MALSSTTTPVDPKTGLIDPYAGFFPWLNDINFKRIFWITAALLFILMMVVTPQYGITGDEITQYNYGTAVWKYFSTFGKDKTAINGEYIVNKTLEYYGGLFDGIAAMLISVFHPKDEFLMRHYLNAIFGFLALIGTGLLAKEVTNRWGVGLLALVLLVCTPRFFGECFNNPKDIPFAAGYVFSLYALIRWLKDLNNPKWGRAIFLGLCIAVGMGIRIGGMLLIVYAGFFFILQAVRAKLWNNPIGFLLGAGQLLLAIVIGYFGCCLFWPFALEHPLTGPYDAFKVMSHYNAVKIGMLFDGEKAYSQNIPWFYEPKLLLLTMPVFVLAGLAGGAAILAKKDTWFKLPFFPIVVFAALFPVFYIAYSHAQVYDGIRHVLFAVPPMLVMAAVFFNWAFRAMAVQFKGATWVPAVSVVLLAVLLYSPVRFSIAAHPNQYVYFNEIEGGVDKAYGYYETDYYMNSVKGGTLKLAKMENLYNITDTVTIGTNCIEPVQRYVEQINPRIKVEYVRWPQRYDKDWDYGIFYSRFIDKDLLQKEGYFPLANTIATIKADDVVLCDIVKRDKERYSLKASRALDAKDYAGAAALYARALAINPQDETSYENYAIALANTGQLDAAIGAITKLLSITPNNVQAHNTAAQIYQAKGDMTNARNEAQTAQSIQAADEEKAGVNEDQ